MKTFAFEDGSFASVASCDGRAYLAFQTDPRGQSQIRIYDLASEQIIRAYDAGAGAAFPLLKPTGSPLMVAWRRADTGRIHYAWPLLKDKPPADLGDIGANNEPFAWDGDWLWWQDADFQIKRGNVVSGMGRETMTGQIGRGTGISRILNGRALLRDFDRLAYGLTFPSYAAGHVGLEGNTGGCVVVRERDRFVARVWPGMDCFAPKIVGWNDGVIAGTSGSGSVRSVVLTSNDFEDGPIVLPTAPPPPRNRPEDFQIVPDGTRITDAIRTVLGANPVRQGDLICIHKNIDQAEWRRVYDNPKRITHWADASRFPGDPGWWTDPDLPWLLDEFNSGVELAGTAQIVDLRPGVPPNRWTQKIRLHGLKGDGVLVDIDPRFPGMYTDLSKVGTPGYTPVGYEKHYSLKNGGFRWEFIVTPTTAKGVLPWGFRDMDVILQDGEIQPPDPNTQPAPSLPFKPCPRPLTSTTKPEPNQMTTAEAMARAAYPAPSDIVEGAMQVFRANLLERDQLAGGLMSSGALRYFFQHYGPAMAARQVRDGIPGSAEGWGDYSWKAVQAAMAVYDRDQKPTTQPHPPTPVAFSGPIGVAGRDFVTP